MSRLILDHVSKTYRTKNYMVRAVEDVSLTLEAEETVAIVGPSGSGKSTLLNLAGLVIKPDSGRIMLDDEDVTELPDRRCCMLRNRHFGYIVQDYALLDDESVYYNIRLPLLYQKEIPASEHRRLIEEAAGALRISNKLKTAAVKLSGGERQRTAIARAIVCGQPFILADEPTGSLDGDNKKLVMDLLINLAAEKKKSLLMVTHDLAMAERCDRILHLINGRLE